MNYYAWEQLCQKKLGMFLSSRFWDTIFFNYVLHICLPPCVLQRGRHHHVKEEKYIWSKYLDDGNNNIFLSEGLAVWRLSRNHFKPVWAETVKNYPARKLELLTPQNRYIGHQCGIWKIMGKAIFKQKKFFLLI